MTTPNENGPRAWHEQVEIAQNNSAPRFSVIVGGLWDSDCATSTQAESIALARAKYPDTEIIMWDDPRHYSQRDSALREVFFEAMKIAGAAVALAEDYSGGESETAQYLSKEYDKLNIKFDEAIDKRNAMHNAIVYSKTSK
jgi:hypothetical protein